MELLYGVVPGILQLGFGNKSKDNLGSGIHSSTRPTMCDVCGGGGTGRGALTQGALTIKQQIKETAFSQEMQGRVGEIG